jgi:hypothetical protein
MLGRKTCPVEEIGELVEVAQETAQNRGFFWEIATLTIVSLNAIIVS